MVTLLLHLLSPVSFLAMQKYSPACDGETPLIVSIATPSEKSELTIGPVTDSPFCVQLKSRAGLPWTSQVRTRSSPKDQHFMKMLKWL